MEAAFLLAILNCDLQEPLGLDLLLEEGLNGGRKGCLKVGGQ